MPLKIIIVIFCHVHYNISNLSKKGDTLMIIPSAKYLRNKARIRIESGKDPQKVVLFYAGISIGATFLVSMIQFILDGQIAHTGGLHNIGLRSVLSTANTILPLLLNILIMCLDLGYMAAMLRIARNQYASPKTLKAGAERFWPLLRSMLLRGILYLGCALAAYYLSVLVFTLTPLSNRFTQLIAPYLSSGEGFDPMVLLNDDSLLDALIPAIRPMLFLYAAALAALLIPLYYRYRFTEFLLVDHPGTGAMFALRTSRLLMRGNVFRMLKIDLSFWWFYLLKTLTTLVVYADILLPMLGISIPGNETFIFVIRSVLYLGSNFAIEYFFLNKVSVTQALAYDSLIPKQNNEGVVLGNIFQM